MEHHEGLAMQQLAPLLSAVRECVFSSAAILMAILCVMLLCHASATVVRTYLIVNNLVPRVAIFQISEQTSMLDNSVDAAVRPIQRSASWLESCESGVYVEGGEMDTNKDV